MPDKEKATKLLGFRDEGGVLVCPADVVDPSVSYTCHVGAEDGSYEPSDDDLKAIGELLKVLGINGAVTKLKSSGGMAFYNKKGVVICRIVKAAAKKEPLPPPPPKQDPTPETVPEPTPEALESAEAAAEAAATVKSAPIVKKVFAKNGSSNGPKKAAKKKKAAAKRK